MIILCVKNVLSLNLLRFEMDFDVLTFSVEKQQQKITNKQSQFTIRYFTL